MPIVQVQSRQARFKQSKLDPNNQCYCDEYCHVFTDGGGNCGPGSIGVVIVIDDEIIVTYAQLLGTHGQTNNIAELNAIWYGLRLAKQFGRPIKIYSDSSYAINSVCGVYNGRKNIELISNIVQYTESYPLSMEFVKCKGHSGIAFNEIADKLATSVLPNK